MMLTSVPESLFLSFDMEILILSGLPKISEHHLLLLVHHMIEDLIRHHI